MEAAAPAVSSSGPLARAAAVGVAYLLAGVLGVALTREPYGFALFWPGNAVALGILLRLPAPDRPPALAACALAAVLLNLGAGKLLPEAAPLALANLLELVLAERIVRAV